MKYIYALLFAFFLSSQLHPATAPLATDSPSGLPLSTQDKVELVKLIRQLKSDLPLTGKCPDRLLETGTNDLPLSDAYETIFHKAAMGDARTLRAIAEYYLYGDDASSFKKSRPWLDLALAANSARTYLFRGNLLLDEIETISKGNPAPSDYERILSFYEQALSARFDRLDKHDEARLVLKMKKIYLTLGNLKKAKELDEMYSILTATKHATHSK